MYLYQSNLEVSIKKKLLGILQAFDEFCTANSLNYFACGGTAIGAVRHHGIIPWDDDIDVYMLRSDYDRLIEIRDYLPERYRLFNIGDDNYIYPFVKICDKKTTLIEYSAFPNCKIGVFLDIFPLDEVSYNLERLKKKKEDYERLLSDFQFTHRKFFFRQFVSFFMQKRIAEALRYFRNTLFLNDSQKQRIRDSFIEYEKDWNSEKGDFLMTHHGIYTLHKELFKKDWFSSSEYLPFDNYKIRVCGGYKQYLTQLFGDYLTPPPVEQRVSHHSHYYLNLKEGLSLSEAKDRIKRGETLVY